MKELTEQEILFCQLYIRNNNGTRAYMDAGFPAKNRNVACVSAHKLLKLPEIKARIELERNNIIKEGSSSPEKVLEELTCLAYGDAPALQKLKALELLGKYHKMFSEKTPTNMKLKNLVKLPLEKMKLLTDEELNIIKGVIDKLSLNIISDETEE